MTWADVAQRPALPRPEPAFDTASPTGGTTAVLDASAVIAGFDRNIAQNLTTVPEVIDECKDAVAKQRLQFLPEGITVQQPSPDAIQRVGAFARAVGEYHTLSAVDLHLLALTYTLEKAVHGDEHLRTSPAPPRAAARSAQASGLPGWGSQGGDWAELDALGDTDVAERPGSGEAEASRISDQVQQLNLRDDWQAEGQDGEGHAPSSHDPAAQSESQSDSDDSSQSSDHSHGDGWGVAAKSSSAQRRNRRKAMRAAQVSSTEPAPVHESQPTSQGAEAASEAGRDAGTDSWVMLLTGDYAMQNVCLQMGMRLVAPDGARVTCVARWALRCAACFKVTLEHGRLFCGQCGNAALDRVEVVVGPEGVAQYGVRRKHNLRGTRYSLPKPRGGKAAQPILREDVLLQKMPKKAPRQADLQDAFAPEYDKDTFTKPGRGKAQPCDQVTAAKFLGGSKQNPNERRMTRSNRRK